MCGRFTLIRLADFTDLFPWIRGPDEPPPPRYNIAPTQAVPVAINQPQPKFDYLVWGLIPFWAKDPTIGGRMINAHVESIAAKNSFKHALRRRRCIVPANGFFEWRKNPDGTKTPVYITLRSARPMGFAGLWDVWQDAKGTELRSFTIITTPANSFVRPIHDRMPAILREEDYRQWLDPAEHPPEDFQKVYEIYPADVLDARPVSKIVNNAKVDTPECIESPVEAPPTQPKSRRKRKSNEGPSLF